MTESPDSRLVTEVGTPQTGEPPAEWQPPTLTDLGDARPLTMGNPTGPLDDGLVVTS